MVPIVVTGGAGYIGSHVCKLLSKEGFLPITFDNLSTGHKEAVKWGPLILGDILDKEKILETLLKYKPLAVMHFASSIVVSESVKSPEKYFRNNIVGSLNLFEAMLESNVKKLIFSSSCAVYGQPQYLPLDENHFKNPINPYGETKLMIEKMIHSFKVAHGFSFVILRYFNASGADSENEIGELHPNESHLIPLLLESTFKKGAKFCIFGNDFETLDGTAIRDYIHVEDIAKAHLKALEHLKKDEESLELNLGNGKGFSVLEVVNHLENILNKKIEFKFDKRRDGDAPILIANTQLANEKLGWRAKYSLDTILSSALEWYKKESK